VDHDRVPAEEIPDPLRRPVGDGNDAVRRLPAVARPRNRCRLNSHPQTTPLRPGSSNSLTSTPASLAERSQLIGQQTSPLHVLKARLALPDAYVHVAQDLMKSTEAILVKLELKNTERSREARCVFLGCSLAYRYAIGSFDKLSLPARLTRTCATYCSNEYAILDDRGLTRPRQRKLDIRPSGGAIHQELQSEEQGTTIRNQEEPPVLILIVGLHRGPAARGELETSARGQATLRPLQGASPGRSWARSASAGRGHPNETADVLAAIIPS